VAERDHQPPVWEQRLEQQYRRCADSTGPGVGEVRGEDGTASLLAQPAGCLVPQYTVARYLWEHRHRTTQMRDGPFILAPA
jgi:hypothetical protein